MNTFQDLINILSDISYKEDIKDISSLYNSHLYILKDYQIIKSVKDKEFSDFHTQSLEIDFIEGDSKASIVSLFPQNSNLIFLSDKLKDRKNSFPTDPTIILDSNGATLLCQLLNEIRPDLCKPLSNRQLLPAEYNLAKRIMFFLVKGNWDFHHSFYLIESYCKNRDGNFLERYAKPYIEGMITLQYLKRDKFLREGKIELDMSQIREAGYDKPEDMVLNQYNLIASDFEKHKYDFEIRVNAINVILLKACIIQISSDSKNHCEKFEELIVFMHNELHAIFHRELFLSYYYLSPKDRIFDGFFNPQKGQKYSTIIKKIESVSWDLALIRFAEMAMWTMNYRADFAIPYILTKDLGLIKFMKNNPINLVAFSKIEKAYSPVISLNIDIEKLFIEKCPDIKVYFEEEAYIKRKRMIEQNDINRFDKIKILKDRLERELQSLL